VAQLVVLGAAGEDDIDAELDRDNTAAGQRYAASALAARPTAEAKARPGAVVSERPTERYQAR
jgi:aminopeptidase N